MVQVLSGAVPNVGDAVVVELKADDHDRFELMYQEAHGDMSHVPWAHGRPSRMLVNWLNHIAPARVRPGARVVVVGCGLGDDVVELADRGFDVVGFDISETAIEWAKERFPAHARLFSVADLFSPPGRYVKRFDLVVEINTIQSLSAVRREHAAHAICELAGPRAIVLAICRGRDDETPLDESDGPPWPLTRTELECLMEAEGLGAVAPVSWSMEDGNPPVLRLCGCFSRAIGE